MSNAFTESTPNHFAKTSVHVRAILSALVALVLPLSAGAASAQTIADYDYENLAFRGIGADYGRIWPNKVVATAQYSIRVDLGYLGPGVRVTPVVSYWSSRMRDSQIESFASQLNRLPALRDRNVTITAADLGDIDWSDLSVGIDAHAVWTTPIGVLTYAGAGVSLHILNGKGAAIEGTFVEDLLDSFAPGLSAMGGAELRFSPSFRLYGELRYTLLNDVRYPGVRLGGAYMIPGREQSAKARGEK